MKKLIYLLPIVILTISSCMTVLPINNYCTTTSSMYNLKQGMSLTDIITTLKAEPKDIYSNTIDKEKVLVFKYKRAYQQINLNSVNAESSLRKGLPIFKDEMNLYVFMDAKTNKLVHYITDSGRKTARKELNEALKLKIRDVNKK